MTESGNPHTKKKQFPRDPKKIPQCLKGQTLGVMFLEFDLNAHEQYQFFIFCFCDTINNN